MKILIVAATQQEIKALLQPDLKWRDDIDFLISGVGVIETTFKLTAFLLSNQYDLVINIGIAGAFSSELKLGEVVFVKSDCFADLGAEDVDTFMPLNEMGLKSDTADVFNATSENKYQVKEVSAITVIADI